jgi:transcription antitermination factor NusG
MGLTGEGCTPWYALQVAPNHEKRVARRLADDRIEPYLPTYRERSRWSDRTVTLNRPLFPCYVFALFDPASDARRVLDLSGVIRIVGAGDDPVAIPENEIEVVRVLVASGNPLAPCQPVAGKQVRVTRGSMTGIVGTLLRIKERYRVVVSLEMLNRAVAVEFDEDWIEPC